MISCLNCQYVFGETENTTNDKRSPCPQCGSTARKVAVSITPLASTIKVSTSTPTIKITVNSAPPFSLGAIVKVEHSVFDGQIITLIDPAYTCIIDALKKDPQIMYQIEPRKWEEIIAAAYDKAGFDEVILTPRSGDLGRDVIAIKKGFGSVKFIEQVKAYSPGHLVKADEVRSLLGVLQAEQDASKAIFTTTSAFAPKLKEDRLIKPFLPTRLELVDKERLLERLLYLDKVT